MNYFDPHIHMTSRTTDDYEAMAKAGIRAVIEPAFWVGQPRTQVGSYLDYFSSLVGWERFRAAQFGIHHFCAIGVNAKEANNEPLAKEALELVPRFALKEGVVAVGEIGFDEITPAEERAFSWQLDFAAKNDLVVMVHSPHRDKKRGILRSLEPKKTDVQMLHRNAPRLGEMLGEDDWFDKMSAAGRDYVRFAYMQKLLAFNDKQKRAILAGQS